MTTDLQREARLVAYMHGWKVGVAGGFNLATPVDAPEYHQGVADGGKAKELAYNWGCVQFGCALSPMGEEGK